MKPIRLQPIVEWLRRVVTQPRSELTHWQMTVRFGYDLSREGARQLARDRAPVMAAALLFRSLFALVPLIVLGTIVVRALGGFEQFQPTLDEFIRAVGGGADAGAGAAAGAGAVDAAAAGRSLLVPANGIEHRALGDWVQDLVEQALSIDLTAIGWIGLAILIYSVTSLAVTIENCFNGIYRAPEGRSWARRVPTYWTVITLAPAVIALTAYVDSRFDSFLTDAITWRWALQVAPVLWSFTATWLVMFVVYKLMPNTTVRAQPALIGAFVAAILLEIGKRTLGAYFDKSMSVSLLYGSLGLIPLFMFWMYVMWLVVLFGLEVAAIMQSLAGRRIEELDRPRGPGFVEPASVLSVMEVIAENFQHAAATTPRVISEATRIPEATVGAMLKELLESGLLHRVDRDDEAVTLAKPPETIATSDLIDVGFRLVDRGSPGPTSTLIRRLRDAQRSLAASATLAQLLPAQPLATDGGQVPDA